MSDALDPRIREEAERTLSMAAAVVQAAPDAIVVTDDHGDILVVNEAALQLLACEHRDVIGARFADLVDGGWATQLGHLLEGRGDGAVLARALEVRLRRFDGTTVPVELSVGRTPIGAAGASTIFARDVSERYADRAALAAVVRELRLATARAEEANRAKSEFLSRMSHELRTPLNAVLGFSELLELEAADRLDTEAIDHIRRAGVHLLSLVDEVLDIARIEAGRADLQPEQFAVGAVLDDVVSLTSAAVRRGEVALVVEPTAATVWADRRRTVQVLVNLVTNAAKYAGAGSEVWVSAATTPAGTVRVTVADDGPGLSAADQVRAFEPFERLEASTSAVEGSGVGLTLCRNLAASMGGGLFSADTHEAGTGDGPGLAMTVVLPGAPGPGDDGVSSAA